MYGPTPNAAHLPLTDAEEHQERRRIRALFERLDRDQDGKMTAADLRQELERLNLPFTQHTLDDILARCDKDRDGHISFDDFYLFCIAKERELREVFDTIDLHKDGVLQLDELCTVLAALGFDVDRDDVAHMFSRMNLNRSGRIEWSEWREFLVLYPSSHVRDVFRFWQRATQQVALLEDYGLPDSKSDVPKPDWWRHMLAGGVAGGVSRTLTAPLDRLRTLFMIQAVERRLSIRGTFQYMVAEGGVPSLWRGNGVNVLKIAPESALKFLAWNHSKALVAARTGNTGEPTAAERVAAGALAGLASQTCIYPMEVLKTRMATAKTAQYRSLAHCATSLAAREGVRGFYRGLTPSLLGVIPYSGIEFAAYETLKKMYCSYSKNEGKPAVPVLLACGVVASGCGQLAAYPLLLIRTRLQVTKTSNGMIKEFQAVLAQGGVRALYRGLLPNFAKSAPAVSISYVIYEHMKTLLNIS